MMAKLYALARWVFRAWIKSKETPHDKRTLGERLHDHELADAKRFGRLSILLTVILTVTALDYLEDTDRGRFVVSSTIELIDAVARLFTAINPPTT